ncbi:MAG: hypothetical protein ACI9PZ_002618 [Parvicella sp.]|jgi:hypothetical protein
MYSITSPNAAISKKMLIKHLLNRWWNIAYLSSGAAMFRLKIRYIKKPKGQLDDPLKLSKMVQL